MVGQQYFNGVVPLLYYDKNSVKRYAYFLIHDGRAVDMSIALIFKYSHIAMVVSMYHSAFTVYKQRLHIPSYMLLLLKSA